MSRDLKAGILVTVIVVILAFMIFRINQGRITSGKAKEYYTLLNDSTGLAQGSKIKVAGINVGQVTKLRLQDNRARIEMNIGTELAVRQGATVTIRSIGYLGDKYLDLSPGPEGNPRLPERSLVPSSGGAGTIESIADKGERLIVHLDDLVKALNEVLNVGGTEQLGRRLNNILANLEKFSKQLGQLDELDQIISDVHDITEKINNGTGTVGKLVNEPETADRINTTLSSVDRLATEVNELRVDLGVQSAIITEFPASRNDFWVGIHPDRKNSLILGTTYRPEGLPVSGEGKTTSQVGINAQFGRRFGPGRVRVGLFEGTAGTALDYFLLGDRIQLFGELYRFQKNQAPQVNIGSVIRVYPPFHLWLGDDYLSQKDRSSFFLGAGLDFNVLESF